MVRASTDDRRETAADRLAIRIDSVEIAADSQEIGIYIPEIAADMAAIAHDMQAIAGCSPETRISFMEAIAHWTEIATDTPEIAPRSREIMRNGLDYGSNHSEINELRICAAS